MNNKLSDKDWNFQLDFGVLIVLLLWIVLAIYCYYHKTETTDMIFYFASGFLFGVSCIVEIIKKTKE